MLNERARRVWLCDLTQEKTEMALKGIDVQSWAPRFAVHSIGRNTCRPMEKGKQIKSAMSGDGC